MYDNLSELLIEHGLQQITMEQLLALPESEDNAVQEYLMQLLESAYDADEAREDGDGGAVDYVYTELIRLWDEAVDLLVDDSIVIDIASFWRVFVFLPVVFYEDPEEDDFEDEAVDADWSTAPIDRGSIIEVLNFGFTTSIDIPLVFSNFETILTTMPDEIIFDFLDSLHDEERLYCLMRLALTEDRLIAYVDELYVRMLLLCSSAVVRNTMIQLFDGLGIEFNLDIDAPVDELWVRDDPIEYDSPSYKIVVCTHCDGRCCLEDSGDDHCFI